jgi:HAD superfamily hydrolase (TIGR01490 family)
MSTSTITAAVFDVDRTLVPVTTTERIFIRYLLRRRVIGLRAVLYTLGYVARRFPRVSPFAAIRGQRTYLAGQPYEKMRRLALACFETDIKPRISRTGIRAIQEHKAQGHTIVLLSGSLHFLLEPLRDYLGADHLIAARMEVVNGKLTGRIEGDYPYGDLKAAIIEHFAREHGIDFSQSYAYADHHTDHAVLRLFGNPVVINARPRMVQIARKEGWPTREFR